MAQVPAGDIRRTQVTKFLYEISGWFGMTALVCFIAAAFCVLDAWVCVAIIKLIGLFK